MTTTIKNVNNLTVQTITKRNAYSFLIENGNDAVMLDTKSDDELIQMAKDLLTPKNDGTTFDRSKFGSSTNPKSLMSTKTLELFGITEQSTEKNDFLGMRKLFSILDGLDMTCTVKSWKSVSPKMVTSANKELVKELIADGKNAIKYEVNLSVTVGTKVISFDVAKVTLFGKMENAIADKCGFAINGTCILNIQEYEINGGYSLGLS